MRERNPNAKVNPDQITDDRLTILNNLREYLRSALTASSLSSHQKKKFTDALKVIDCLRFVKVNEAFLRYAFFADKRDSSVYSLTQDGRQHVIRDFNGTALDIFIYQDKTQYPDQQKALEICIAAHLDLVKDFEAAVQFVTKNKKLDEFINKLQYDKTTGCLVKRTAASLKYVENLKKGLFIFEDLLNGFLAEAPSEADEEAKEDVEKIRKALSYFSPYLWKPCLYETADGIQEALITPDFIVDYLVNILGYQDPRPETSRKQVLSSTQVHSNELESEEEKEADSGLESEPKPEVSYLVKTSAEALKCIADEKGLAKNISAKLDPRTGLGANQTDSLTYHVNQLSDPANYRPYKKLAPGTNRSKYWDTTDGKHYNRRVAAVRGGPKPAGWKYSKKEAATLMPRNGKIHLYSLPDSVFFLFNIDACYLKRSAKTGKLKYIWKTNVGSNAKGWVGSYNRWEPSVTLEELRAYLRSYEGYDSIPSHNEILACFAKEALNAVGIQNNTLFDRLNALRVRETLRGTLGVHLPILISTPDQGPRVYTRENQLADIQMALNYSSNTKEAKVLRQLHKTPGKLLELYRQQDSAAKSLVKLAQRSEKEALTLLQKHREFFMIEEEVEELKSQALLEALKNNHIHLALKLIELGAKLDYCESTEKNKSLLWLILESGNPILRAKALERTLESDTIEQAIFLAAKQNRLELLLPLLNLKPGLSLNRWREDGKTAFDFAKQQGNAEMMSALKAAGAKEGAVTLLDESKEKSLQTIRAVLLKIADQLEKIKKTPAETKALQKILSYSRVLAGELRPEGGFPRNLSLEAINDLRKQLLALLNTEGFKTYSENFYAGVHASLLALCYWWPTNKAEGGAYLSSEGKPLQNENRVLTSIGQQFDKEEIRKLFAKNSAPCYPNTTVLINQRDQSYIAETAGPIYLSKFSQALKSKLASITFLTGLMLYPIITFILAALLPQAGPLSFIVIAAAMGGGILPGLLVGLAITGLVAYFTSKPTLQAKIPNPQVKPLLERPELPPSLRAAQTPQRTVACENGKAEEKEETCGSAAKPRQLRDSASHLLMPPPLTQTEQPLPRKITQATLIPVR